jgi:hypothetical protein
MRDRTSHFGNQDKLKSTNNMDIQFINYEKHV